MRSAAGLGWFGVAGFPGDEVHGNGVAESRVCIADEIRVHEERDFEFVGPEFDNVEVGGDLVALDDSSQEGIDGLAEGGFGAGFVIQVEGRVEAFAVGELLQLNIVLGQVHCWGHGNSTADGAEDPDEEGLKFIMSLSVFICVIWDWIGVGDAFDAEFGVFEIQEEGRLQSCYVEVAKHLRHVAVAEVGYNLRIHD